MSRTARIPPELKAKPFTLQEARRAGLTLSSLRGRAWQSLGSELYRWSGLPEDPWQVLRAWQSVLPADAVFVGGTAAWILGLDLIAQGPVEVAVPPQSSLRSRAGLTVRRCQIPPSETVKIRALRTTTLHRTLVDLCLLWPAVEVLAAIDMALSSHATDDAALDRYIEMSEGRAGVRRLRSLAKLAAPAESPMETRLRWLLIQGGLPRPEVQTDLYDGEDRLIARADLYYPEARLVIEYDGSNHRDRLVEDNRRQNLLLNAGYALLRFVAADIYNRADVVGAQVRAALRNSRLVPSGRNLSWENARLVPNGRNGR